MPTGFIPDTANAAFSDQAGPDSVDFDILVNAAGGTAVGSGCAVTSSGSADGKVSVAAGSVLVAGTSADVASGLLSIGANSSGVVRYDLVVASSSGVKSVIAGAAAANPVFPTFNPATQVVLAAVRVPNGHTSGSQVASNTIVDKRVLRGKYATSLGDGTATTFTVTHNLGCADLSVDLWDTTGTKSKVDAEFRQTDANTLTVLCSPPPSSGQYRLVVKL